MAIIGLAKEYGIQKNYSQEVRQDWLQHMLASGGAMPCCQVLTWQGGPMRLKVVSPG